MRAKGPRRACHFDGAELSKLECVDQLVKDALHQLDVLVRSMDVNRRATEAHRNAKLGFERAQVRPTRPGQPEQQARIAHFDVGGYIGLLGAALRSWFDDESLACPARGGERQS